MDPKTLELKLVPSVSGTIASVAPPPPPPIRYDYNAGDYNTSDYHAG